MAGLLPPDAQTVRVLEKCAADLRGCGMDLLVGICQERAQEALVEAASILEDAAENCRNLPGELLARQMERYG